MKFKISQGKRTTNIDKVIHKESDECFNMHLNGPNDTIGDRAGYFKILSHDLLVRCDFLKVETYQNIFHCSRKKDFTQSERMHDEIKFDTMKNVLIV